MTDYVIMTVVLKSLFSKKVSACLLGEKPSRSAREDAHSSLKALIVNEACHFNLIFVKLTLKSTGAPKNVLFAFVCTLGRSAFTLHEKMPSFLGGCLSKLARCFNDNNK